MENQSWLDKAFNPQAVAIVGVSVNADERRDFSGHRILRVLKDGNFSGRLYPINPHADSILGVRAYPSVVSVPEPLDLAIVAVPARSVPVVLEECRQAGITNIHICSSGFGESGESEGRIIEAEVKRIANQGGLHVIGPNCLGYTVPAIGLNMYDTPAKDGPVAMISQSGGHAQTLVAYGPLLDIGFSKVISYGNALITDATHYLEYLIEDPNTKIICMYIEGTTHGQKLRQLVRQAALTKHIIIWKGGVSPFGARAAATHTSSLAGNSSVWSSFFRQTGAIRVHSIDEMADVVVTFLRLRSVSRNGIVVMTGGGGQNVADGDLCAEEGLELATLSDGAAARLRKLLPPVNQSTVNPIDSPAALYDPQLLHQVMQVLGSDANVTTVILEMSIFFQQRATPEVKSAIRNCITRFNSDYPTKAAVVAIRGSELNGGDASALRRDFVQSGITAYGSLRSASRALYRSALSPLQAGFAGWE